MALSFFKKKPDTFDFDVSRVCKTCGTMFQGRFCPRCGEKVFEPHERSILNFLDSLLNAFTFLDGKFIKSLKLLVTRPGELSRNIADGVRAPYMKMVSLFFVANFFYFLIPTWDSFNSSLYVQMNQLNHSNHATRMVNERIEKEHITLEAFTEKYQAQSTNLSKMLLILAVMMFTLLLMVINYSRKVYFFDHLLFAMEFYSYQIIVNLIIITYLFFVIIWLGDLLSLNLRIILTDGFFTPVAMISLLYFLIRGQINFYYQKWYWGVLRAATLYFLFSQSVQVYRSMLFYITMWTV